MRELNMISCSLLHSQNIHTIPIQKPKTTSTKVCWKNASRVMWVVRNNKRCTVKNVVSDFTSRPYTFHFCTDKPENQSFCTRQYNDLSQNHRMVWVEKDLQRSSSPAPPQWAGTSSNRPGCSEPCRMWPSTLSGRRHLPEWAICAICTTLGNLCQCFTTLIKNFFLIASVILPSFSLIPLPLALLH